MIALIPIPILGLAFQLYENEKVLILIIVILIAMIIYGIFMIFNVFLTYICLDIKNGKLIIRESPGIKKEEINLDNVIDIKVSNGIKYKELFTIDIYCISYTKKIISWSFHPSCRLAFFSVYKRQTKRLNDFADKCNKYLNSL